ncbi:MAG: endonuclease/exonuclease/phosphatase family protein [Prevotellaceae bacterium]|jgi:predicted extracellular nuclease|nr:endonuclease/exonuclease/phosphatase family protein [Prevotellaceae bacterium]
MKKRYCLLLILLAAGICPAGYAQEARYVVAFYNVENLFDTLLSPDVHDEEFTPEGPKEWNGKKYWHKMNNLEEVFFAIASTVKTYPTVIGLSEIENRNVLEDIVALKKLQKANYQIAHFDSPDARGVDVALLYRPDRFNYEGSAPIKTVVESRPDFRTRDILMVWGTIEGERFCFFVCHWSSRIGGQQQSEYLRMAAAQCVRHAADSMMQAYPGIKIAIMGDLNDDPIDKSIYEILGAGGDRKEVPPTGYFNPFYAMFKKGFGSLAYNDAWNLFDNIIVNGALANGAKGTLTLQKTGGKYYGAIFNRPFLLQKSGQYKNYPLRTYVGNVFQGGYSDHFPVFISIAK